MPINRTPPFRTFVRSLTLSAGLLFAAASCGGGGGTTSPNNNNPGSTNTTITNIAVSGNVTSINVGESTTLTATARNSAGSPVSATFAWTSSAPNIATVNASTGVVTGVAVGSAGITAAAAGITGTRFISVATPGQQPPPLANAQIDMPGTSFEPSNIRLLVGGTVTFVFTAVAHDVNFSGSAGAPAMIPVTTNATIQRLFPTAGTFTIVCTLHAGMTGVITVQ
jgi:plastocyanin